MAPLDGVSPNGFKTVQEIDLLGTYHTVKATIAELKRTHGTYTHISATLHYTGIPWQAPASAAKAGVDALSQSIAVEYGPFGIRSNVIAPGVITGTEGADRLTPKGAESIVESRIPQQRMGVIVSNFAAWSRITVLTLDNRMILQTWAFIYSLMRVPTALVLNLYVFRVFEEPFSLSAQVVDGGAQHFPGSLLCMKRRILLT